MNTKKLLQSFILIAVLLALFTSTSPAFAAGCGTSVTVVSGDTLRKIADRCVTTVSALRRANPEIGLGNLIYPGQVLLLPGAILNGNNGYNTYVVMRGDTLKSLATRFGTTVDILVSLNNSIVNVNLIYEGQRLTVPSGQGVPVPPPPTGGQVYYVQRGDTLRKIAAKFNTTVDAILKVNPQITNPNVIYVGQAITIPAEVSTHIVQKGDTLRIIASKYGTTVDALLALNPGIKNPNLIYVGQVIRVR
ncbi:MAG: LysM peptidoglycan-binding domain-containing protein [Anaerolineae bacterium]|nr:LysM peptidoglycan-binding domain-containing protein [Anaerolineae bacterium]MCI0607587.1 LysM peptidoglycan-binding domain-containing protein [Anaerolineae bacterium]